jgi:hypothetical protein
MKLGNWEPLTLSSLCVNLALSTCINIINLLFRKDTYVNEHERLSNFTLRHKVNEHERLSNFTLRHKVNEHGARFTHRLDNLKPRVSGQGV